jgi:hypothetical protein
VTPNWEHLKSVAEKAEAHFGEPLLTKAGRLQPVVRDYMNATDPTTILALLSELKAWKEDAARLARCLSQSDDAWLSADTLLAHDALLKGEE